MFEFGWLFGGGEWVIFDRVENFNAQSLSLFEATELPERKWQPAAGRGEKTTRREDGDTRCAVRVFGSATAVALEAIKVSAMPIGVRAATELASRPSRTGIGEKAQRKDEAGRPKEVGASENRIEFAQGESPDVPLHRSGQVFLNPTLQP